MRKAMVVVLVFGMAVGAWAQGQAKAKLVRFVVVNLSGSPREVHHRGELVALPVAERVALQVPEGDAIEITSRQNSKADVVMVVKAEDEGRVVPVR